MKRNMRGSITLETSLVLPIFIFLFLAINGLFIIVTAQNQISHAFIQAGKSLSLDAYHTEKSGSVARSDTTRWEGAGDLLSDIIRVGNNQYLASSSDWYNAESTAKKAIKKRFIGYLTGGQGDAKAQADTMLEAYSVIDGLDGIKFDCKIDGNIITMTIKYKLQFWFDFLDAGKIPVEQSLKIRMWKPEEE